MPQWTGNDDPGHNRAIEDPMGSALGDLFILIRKKYRELPPVGEIFRERRASQELQASGGREGDHRPSGERK
ncbi:MAG TPA: hypothetical protein VLF93_04990 [Candidatus Saccharimonadales bacterium]|nr:hypothetical protein [Candidatus Saccharimonadales bacterium]